METLPSLNVPRRLHVVLQDRRPESGTGRSLACCASWVPRNFPCGRGQCAHPPDLAGLRPHALGFTLLCSKVVARPAQFHPELLDLSRYLQSKLPNWFESLNLGTAGRM